MEVRLIGGGKPYSDELFPGIQVIARGRIYLPLALCGLWRQDSTGQVDGRSELVVDVEVDSARAGSCRRRNMIPEVVSCGDRNAYVHVGPQVDV